MKLLGRSGAGSRGALLLAGTLVAAFSTDAAAAVLLGLVVVALALAAPRRLAALALALVLTALVYGGVLAAADADPRLAVRATARFGCVFAAALWISAETPAAAWARAARGRLRVVLDAAASALPVLSRDAEAMRDAAILRGYSPAAASVRAIPAAFVRTLRRGRITDEALAQAGLDGPTERYFAHRWNAHDSLVLALALAVAIALALAPTLALALAPALALVGVAWL